MSEKVDWDNPDESFLIFARFLDEFKKYDKGQQERTIIILKVLSEKENE